MEKEKAVADTSTLLYVTKLNIFHLTKNMFSQILVPEQVINEIFQKDSPENNLIEIELNKFLKIVNITEMKNIPTDIGEQSAISYCLKHNIKTFLSDDKNARIIAESFGLKAKGILGIFLWNFENKNIKNEECKNMIDKLIEKGFYISPQLYNQVIKTLKGL